MIRELKPNELVHVCQMITGDRFYLKTDDKREVWELRFHTMVKVRGLMKKLSQCKNDDGDTRRFDANRLAVFLRRTKPPLKREKHFTIERYFA